MTTHHSIYLFKISLGKRKSEHFRQICTHTGK